MAGSADLGAEGVYLCRGVCEWLGYYLTVLSAVFTVAAADDANLGRRLALRQGTTQRARSRTPYLHARANHAGGHHDGALASPASPLTPESRVQTLDISDSLVERAQGGDQRARTELCVIFMIPLRRYFAKSLPDRQDADDAAQHTLLRMLEGLPRYRPSVAPFRAWLFTIAKNHMIDRSRGTVRTEPTEPGAVVRARESLQHHDIPSSDEDDRMLRTLIAPLPMEQQRALILIYVHDLTSAQAGRVLGRSEASVRQLHKRARDTLHTLIMAQSVL